MTAHELEQQPAFPWKGSYIGGDRGPTLLIEFTKAAMQGLLTRDYRNREALGEDAVAYAKATLAELAKEL